MGSPLKLCLIVCELETLTNLQNQEKAFKSNFLVSKCGRLIPIDIGNVAFFYIRHEVTILHTLKENTYMTDYSLDHLEQDVNPHDFYRVNRQFLINRHVVEEVEPHFARKLLVKSLTPTPEHIIISKAKASNFTRWLAG
jgi:two-component system, LytTR family, response regulator LytT